MSMKKKGLSLLLCAALSLSLAACSTKPETPAQPTAEPTAIPVTAAPEAAAPETPAAENRNVPVISVRCENEDFYTADNAALLLVYACAEPSVSMNGNDAAAAAINEALHKQYKDFAVCVESSD